MCRLQKSNATSLRNYEGIGIDACYKCTKEGRDGPPPPPIRIHIRTARLFGGSLSSSSLICWPYHFGSLISRASTWTQKPKNEDTRGHRRDPSHLSRAAFTPCPEYIFKAPCYPILSVPSNPPRRRQLASRLCRPPNVACQYHPSRNLKANTSYRSTNCPTTSSGACWICRRSIGTRTARDRASIRSRRRSRSLDRACR